LSEPRFSGLSEFLQDFKNIFAKAKKEFCFAIPQSKLTINKGARMSSPIIDFTDKVISQKNKSITDEIFLLIQNDKDLMQEYLNLVEKNTLGDVNRQIGKRIKESYRLTNDERNKEPSSTLIKSYQEFV
jgi:hypothetical protein